MNNTTIIKITILFLFIFIMFSRQVSVLGEDGEEYEQYLKSPGFYSKVVNFIRDTQKGKKTVPSNTDFFTIQAADLLISGFLFWVGLKIITKSWRLAIKQYLWFLFIFNAFWFISLILFRTCWNILDFLIVRLRPDLTTAIVDGFSVCVLAAAVLIYIWLIARTFQLGFYNSLSLAFIFHLLYFLVIFATARIDSKNNRFLETAGKTLGFRAVIDSYLSDVGKVTTGVSVVKMLRFRPYHI